MDNQNRPRSGSAGRGTAVEELDRRAREAEQNLRGEQGVTEQVEQKAKEVGEQAVQSAEEAVREQQHSLAAHLSNLSKAVNYAADRLRQDNEGWLATYAEQAAGGIERFRDSLETQEPGEVMGQLEEYGRRSPQAFIEIALLGGFLLGRFLKSSGSRVRHDQGYSEPQQPMQSASSQPTVGEGQAVVTPAPTAGFPAVEPDEEVYE